MLKLALIESKSSLYWYSFVDEFSKKSYNGKTFNKMIDAIQYANETRDYLGNKFDLDSINKYYPEYLILNSLDV